MSIWRRKKRKDQASGTPAPAPDSPLDQGLRLLNERLGNGPTHRQRRAARTRVIPTGDIPRAIFYAPDMDGQAEPGEVVWFNVPTTPMRERSMLVVGRERQDVLGLLISSDEIHADAGQHALDVEEAHIWNPDTARSAVPTPVFGSDDGSAVGRRPEKSVASIIGHRRPL